VATAVVATAALGLTACSSSSSGDSSGSAPSAGGGAAAGAVTGTITGIFDAQYKQALEPIVQAFQAKYPGTTVKIDYQGGEVGNLVSTQLQAGTAPDILLTFPGGDPNSSSDNVVPLAAGGLIAPFEASWQKDIPETWKSQVEYEGKLYAFPGAVQPLSAIYNQTMLDELGLKAPSRLDEVIKLCADAKAKGKYAYAQGLGEASAGPQMLTFGQTAGLVYGPNPTWDQGLSTGKVTYPNSGWQTQFQIYKQMSDAGCFGDGALGRTRTQGQDAVAQRQALGLVDVGAVLAGIKKADPNDKFVITAIPATNDGTNYITALPIYTLTANAKAKNLPGAIAFLQFAGEPAQSAAFATGFNAVPLVPNSSFQPSAELKAFNDLVVSNKTAPLPNVVPEVQQQLNEKVQSMLLGKDTPESVAKALQDAYDSSAKK
jgi:raffinose/stachyose/melibiose transport system substrate-binding protein